MITLKVTDNFILVFNSDLDFKYFLKSKNKRIHLIPLHNKVRIYMFLDIQKTCISST